MLQYQLGGKMKKTLIIWIVLILTGCGSKQVSFEDDLNIRFAKAIAYFEKGKYTRANEEFQFIVMNNPGSSRAIESHFYLGESYFKLKSYSEAMVEFDRFARDSQDIQKVEDARFKICECAVNLSHGFEKDQTSTHAALDKLQYFIEDYPNHDNTKKAEALIDELRDRLAQKSYESARLYLKLEEYDSAHLYFNEVLEHYYDTKFADEARVAIIFTYILEGNRDMAEKYLQYNKTSFESADKFQEASLLFEKTENGLSMSDYIRLYK